MIGHIEAFISFLFYFHRSCDASFLGKNTILGYATRASSWWRQLVLVQDRKLFQLFGLVDHHPRLIGRTLSDGWGDIRRDPALMELLNHDFTTQHSIRNVSNGNDNELNFSNFLTFVITSLLFYYYLFIRSSFASKWKLSSPKRKNYFSPSKNSRPRVITYKVQIFFLR